MSNLLNEARDSRFVTEKWNIVSDETQIMVQETKSYLVQKY